MNPSLLIILAGGVLVVAAAAASNPKPPTANNLVESATKLNAVFNLYSKKMVGLTDDEMLLLAQLNADAKHIPFMSFDEWRAKEFPKFLAKWNGVGIQPTLETYYNPEDTFSYRKAFFLPPGADQNKGPDVFSAWADWIVPESKNSFKPTVGPILECSEEQPGSSHVSAYQGIRPEDCLKGTWIDWFGRPMGEFVGDNTIGKSEFEILIDGYSEGFQDIWSAIGSDVLRSTADIASNFPGIGTVVAAGASFLASIGSGESIENATLAAGRSAIPSAARAAYDIGVGLATQGELDVEAVAQVAMAAAIQLGVGGADITEQLTAIKSAYDSAKETGVEIRNDLGHLSTTIDLVNAAGA